MLDTHAGKTFLLIRLRKPTDHTPVPHLGLAYLSGILRRKGHRVVVLDELLYRDGQPPDVLDLAREVAPDVIGLSVYTSTLTRSLQAIERLGSLGKPIVVGGPHATIYHEALRQERGIDYVVRGEAENVIADLLESAEPQPTPRVVKADVPTDLDSLPRPDFLTFLNSETMPNYPLSTSRGCPYGCTFCVVERVASRRWRPRDPVACAEELEMAKRMFPLLRQVKIVDDCPTRDPERFKVFLRECVRRELGLTMVIDNLRADTVDEELVTLARAAGCWCLCLGVEHGDPEVFAAIHKGETLEDIRRAADIIKGAGLELYLCFVVGLPGDSMERTRRSIDLARSLDASLVYWNMAHPFPGSKIREWFEQNGATFHDDRDYTSYDVHSFDCRDPVVETPDFTRWERKKAYFLAAVETDQYQLGEGELERLIDRSIEYELYEPVVRSLRRQLQKRKPAGRP